MSLSQQPAEEANAAADDGPVRQGLERQATALVVCVVLVSSFVRGGYAWSHRDLLLEDRDAYLALGEHLVVAGQYGVGHPTAFRPPLYPFVVAGCFLLERLTTLDAQLFRGAVNVLFAAATIWLTFRVGQRLLSSAAGVVAACGFAASPLALRYVAFSMTESICPLLLVAVVDRTITLRRLPSASRAVLWGLVVGLAAACRPTVWVAAALLLAGACVVGPRLSLRRTLLAIAAAVLTALPWIARNAAVFGQFVPLTTHGGYTLALGNNDDFYDQVVLADGQKVWTTGQQEWLAREQLKMQALGIRGEVQQDEYFKQRARETITQRPADFLHASWLRWQRFFSVVPTESASQPSWQIVLVGFFYSVTFVVSLGGVIRLVRVDRMAAFLLVVPIAGFLAVHTLYWSNARMRLPIEPCIYLLAAACIYPPRRHSVAAADSSR